jgi:hypothetical protein
MADLKIGVNRKVSTGNFGSHGAGCEITVTLPDTTKPDEVVAHAKLHPAYLETLIEQHLANDAAKSSRTSSEGFNGRPGASDRFSDKSDPRGREDNSEDDVPAGIRLHREFTEKGRMSDLWELHRAWNLPRKFVDWEEADCERVKEFLATRNKTEAARKSRQERKKTTRNGSR